MLQPMKELQQLMRILLEKTCNWIFYHCSATLGHAGKEALYFAALEKG